jgi:hypothetical protein
MRPLPQLRLVALAALALLVPTGCDLLFPPAFGPGAGPGSTPGTMATYAKGLATVTVTRGADVQKIELRRIGPGSTLTSMIGADVTWRNHDGWILHVTAFGAGGAAPIPMPATAQVVLQRLNGGEYWTTQLFVEDRCIVTMKELSEKRIAGDATCKGLRWIDGIAAQGMGGAFGAPPYIQVEAPFDAEITFEATP